MFGAPALVALLLVAFESQLAPTGALPVPMWIIAILVVDVAHVWSTIYRSYLDRSELARRPRLYVGVPVVCYLVGFLAATVSISFFWTILAYVAVFHFIRQQYGWVALYNRRAGDKTRRDRWIDRFVIYSSTVFPVIWWHAHLPRKFNWFMPGDFFSGLDAKLLDFLWPVYAFAFVLYLGRQGQRWYHEHIFRSGKNLVVVTTALCWGVGIIATNTDWSFTVTNVLIHGVPYLGIVWIYGRRTEYPESSWLHKIFAQRRWLVFLLLVILLAYTEEWAWDRFIWHEQPKLFPLGAFELSIELKTLLLPLLALPQATHYVLDAWIWKTRSTENPHLADAMALSLSSE